MVVGFIGYNLMAFVIRIKSMSALLTWAGLSANHKVMVHCSGIGSKAGVPPHPYVLSWRPPQHGVGAVRSEYMRLWPTCEQAASDPLSRGGKARKRELS